MPGLANTACSTLELAEVLGLTPQHIRRLHDQKVLRRNKHGFRLAESAQAYLQYREAVVRKESSKFGDSYTRARASRMLALAQIETLRARQLRGELIKGEDADSTFMLILRNARDRLRAIPSRLMHELAALNGDAAKANRILRGEIDRVLRELANSGSNARIRREHHETRESTNGDEPVE
jgi:hypothetical protein